MNYRTIEEYLDLPYTVEVIKDSTDGYTAYVASVKELPGCLTQVESYADLGWMLEDAMRLWIGMCIEQGQPVPEPRPAEEYSGMAEAAQREGVSLNQWVNVALAHYAARGAAAAPPPARAKRSRRVKV
jgi:predicted RNase H-like HicB family nuclease